MRRSLRVLLLLVLAVLGPGGLSSARGQAPVGQMTLVFNISIVPRWFDVRPLPSAIGLASRAHWLGTRREGRWSGCG